MDKASESLKNYIYDLKKAYITLNSILELEAEDIASSDEIKLSRHVELEQQSIKQILSLTASVRTYLEKLQADEESLLILKEIATLRTQASGRIDRNIESLRTEMESLKLKTSSFKLPQSARRVYYSGNNPTLMDIEI